MTLIRGRIERADPRSEETIGMLVHALETHRAAAGAVDGPYAEVIASGRHTDGPDARGYSGPGVGYHMPAGKQGAHGVGCARVQIEDDVRLVQ